MTVRRSSISHRALDVVTLGPLARWFEEGARLTWGEKPAEQTPKRGR